MAGLKLVAVLVMVNVLGRGSSSEEGEGNFRMLLTVMLVVRYHEDHITREEFPRLSK